MNIKSVIKKDFNNYFKLRYQLYESELKTAKKDTYLKLYLQKPKRTEEYKQFIKMLNTKNKFFVIAEDKERPVGYLFGFIDFFRVDGKKNKFGYLDTLVIDESYRRKGIGKILHDSIIKGFKKQKIKWTMLRVDAHNEAGMRFYVKEGYYPTELRMVKRLQK